MTKNELKAIIEKRECEFYGLRALTEENVEQLKRGEDLANSVDYCDDYSTFEDCPELNGVSTIGIDYFGDLDESFDRAVELVHNYVNNGIVLIGGDSIDNYSVDEGELVISFPKILGYLEG